MSPRVVETIACSPLGAREHQRNLPPGAFDGLTARNTYEVTDWKLGEGDFDEEFDSGFEPVYEDM